MRPRNGDKAKPREFDAGGYLIAELLADIGDGDEGVFDDVVEDAGLDGGGIHAHFGEDGGDGEGVGEVGLAGLADLALVVGVGEGEGFVEGREVVIGAVFAHLLFQGFE